VNTIKFEQRLTELLKEFGCEMTTNVLFTITQPARIENDLALNYARVAQPVRVSFSADAVIRTEWQWEK